MILEIIRTERTKRKGGAVVPLKKTSINNSDRGILIIDCQHVVLEVFRVKNCVIVLAFQLVTGFLTAVSRITFQSKRTNLPKCMVIADTLTSETGGRKEEGRPGMYFQTQENNGTSLLSKLN
ncbi:hypothetical protein QQP08_017595 [Theobroma cacao]|nr:hypothetical protein QQP08_017595 [Theobroma cacao]